jgi:hypothetical protein
MRYVTVGSVDSPVKALSLRSLGVGPDGRRPRDTFDQDGIQQLLGYHP